MKQIGLDASETSLMLQGMSQHVQAFYASTVEKQVAERDALLAQIASLRKAAQIIVLELGMVGEITDDEKATLRLRVAHLQTQLSSWEQVRRYCICSVCCCGGEGRTVMVTIVVDADAATRVYALPC